MLDVYEIENEFAEVVPHDPVSYQRFSALWLHRAETADPQEGFRVLQARILLSEGRSEGISDVGPRIDRLARTWTKDLPTSARLAERVTDLVDVAVEYGSDRDQLEGALLQHAREDVAAAIHLDAARRLAAAGRTTEAASRLADARASATGAWFVKAIARAAEDLQRSPIAQLRELPLVTCDGHSAPWKSSDAAASLIVFWDDTCAPCIASLRELAPRFPAGSNTGIELVPVHRKEEGERVRAIASKLGVADRVRIDTGEAWELLTIRAEPTFLVVSRGGDVILRCTGWSAETRRKLDESLDSAKAEPSATEERGTQR